MPEPRQIVINTGTIIALIAGTGSLDILKFLYGTIYVPFEVKQEIVVRNATLFGAAEFQAAEWLTRLETPTLLSPFLKNSLDVGEAAVIQTALDKGIQTVCIDEAVGRRVARLNGLSVTGSIGVLVRAKSLGYSVDVFEAIEQMRQKGVWVSDRVVQSLRH